MTDVSQYSQQMNDLKKMRQVDRKNSFYQMLNGKRNIREIDEFLNTYIEPKAFGTP